MDLGAGATPAQATGHGKDVFYEQHIRDTTCVFVSEPTEQNHTDCRGTEFKDLDLDGVDLRFANLAESTFTNVSMEEGQLGSADLSGSTFEEVMLRGADIKYANLSNSQVVQTTQKSSGFLVLERADLSNANLQRIVARANPQFTRATTGAAAPTDGEAAASAPEPGSIPPANLAAKAAVSPR